MKNPSIFISEYFTCSKRLSCEKWNCLSQQEVEPRTVPPRLGQYGFLLYMCIVYAYSCNNDKEEKVSLDMLSSYGLKLAFFVIWSVPVPARLLNFFVSILEHGADSKAP